MLVISGLLSFDLLLLGCKGDLSDILLFHQQLLQVVYLRQHVVCVYSGGGLHLYVLGYDSTFDGRLGEGAGCVHTLGKGGGGVGVIDVNTVDVI